MIIAKCDSKGRLYLREAVRKRLGNRFVVVESKDSLTLRSVARDPVKELEKMGEKLRGKSLNEIKRMIREEALKEVMNDLRGH